MRMCHAVPLGLVDYQEAWELQKSLVQKRQRHEIEDTLLLLEHPHVFTIGRRGKAADILLPREIMEERGVGVIDVDRGGEVTYHGPGQLVGYPIMDLRVWGGGPLRYVRALEESLVAALARLHVQASQEPGLTGVWVQDRKIAAIGVRISQGVTSHGFALNVNTDLTYFAHIVSCGLPGVSITSMAQELGCTVDMGQVMEVVKEELARPFGWTVLTGVTASPRAP